METTHVHHWEDPRSGKAASLFERQDCTWQWPVPKNFVDIDMASFPATAVEICESHINDGIDQLETVGSVWFQFAAATAVIKLTMGVLGEKPHWSCDPDPFGGPAWQSGICGCFASIRPGQSTIASERKTSPSSSASSSFAATFFALFVLQHDGGAFWVQPLILGQAGVFGTANSKWVG